MTKKEYFELFEKDSHVGNQIQQDRIYDIALALFKNIDEDLFKQWSSLIQIWQDEYDSCVYIKIRFVNLIISYYIDIAGGVDSSIISNEKVESYSCGFKQIEGKIEDITKEILKLLKSQKNNLNKNWILYTRKE